jgi:hypothetical protein
LFVAERFDLENDTTDGLTMDLTLYSGVNPNLNASGWDKRQATLVLYLFADGVGTRIKPKLIFHGASGDSNRILKREQHLYNKGVTVEFNPTAYNTEKLLLKFIDEDMLPELLSGPAERIKSLISPGCFRWPHYRRRPLKAAFSGCHHLISSHLIVDSDRKVRP